MGQYYVASFKPALCKKWNCLNSHKFGNGAKLTEHSYIGNEYVEAFMKIIYNNPMRVVWAGDYADKEKGKEDNIYGLAKELTMDEVKLWQGIATHNENSQMRYVVNFTKKQYIDLNKVTLEDEYGFKIHPLPLLTSEGNGRGLGDYHGDCMEYVGTWARDVIGVCDEMTEENFKEVEIPFFEKYE